jgi:hypothetical protein
MFNFKPPWNSLRYTYPVILFWLIFLLSVLTYRLFGNPEPGTWDGFGFVVILFLLLYASAPLQGILLIPAFIELNKAENKSAALKVKIILILIFLITLYPWLVDILFPDII